jgi:hypothetical protein
VFLLFFEKKVESDKEDVSDEAFDDVDRGCIGLGLTAQR